MNRTGVLFSLALLVSTACAGARIPPSPVIPPPGEAFRGVVLQPCVLLHQYYETDRSTALEGGDGKIRMAFATIVVKHPNQGVIVIDPSVGLEKQQDFAANPWPLRREMGDGSTAKALDTLLKEAGIAPESVKWALITHFHWDHVNGAPDVPNAQVLVREPDLAWADHGHTMIYDAVPHHAVDRIRSRIKEFKTDGPAYEGFAGSYDLLGDGSVIGVPTPGHTPGSVSWFVNSGDGRRWLFVGDAAWIGEGISRPVMKGWKGRLLDNDNEKTGETLSRLHALQAARPLTVPPDGHGVQVVTAHDPAGLATLPVCSK